MTAKVLRMMWTWNIRFSKEARVAGVKGPEAWERDTDGHHSEDPGKS
jgi:hypothetical protein